ncbi:MAG: ABC transporter ATP-binding protein [Eubacteriales bacterium]|nr:ABC transporter ATP-binding protein [Eubacteriales bacterium]
MIKIKNLTVKYPDGTEALRSLDLAVNEGESIALMGSNGAGKSSLLLAITGIAPYADGEIYVDDILLSKKTVADVRQRVGMIFQDPDDQLFMPSVFDDVAFGPRNKGLDEKETVRVAESTLEELKISHLSSRVPGKLSGGEKKLAALAGVLAMDPSNLLFDEPAAFLDPGAKRRLISLVRDLDHTKIIATHDGDIARQLCSRVIILKKGSLSYDGTPDILDDLSALEKYGL